MNGISGLVSIMMDDKDYSKLSKLEQLEHDLSCAIISGTSGYFTYEDYLKRIKDVGLLLTKEKRKVKIKQIENES